jgi:hypothetical protein
LLVLLSFATIASCLISAATTTEQFEASSLQILLIMIF